MWLGWGEGACTQNFCGETFKTPPWKTEKERECILGR